jgi:hypothetical protein
MAFAVAALAWTAAAHASSTPTALTNQQASLAGDQPLCLLSLNTQATDDGVADEIFQNNFVSARSVAAFARNGQPVGTVDETRFDAAPGSADPDLFKASNSDTTGAKGPARQAKPKALLTFWAESNAATDMGIDTGVSAEAAAAAAAAIATGTGASSVLIPLPLAAWSALSVMGGVGAMAGFRKLRRRLK